MAFVFTHYQKAELRTWDLLRRKWAPGAFPPNATIVKFDRSGALAAIATGEPDEVQVRRQGRRLWSASLQVRDMALSSDGRRLVTLEQVQRQRMTFATRVEVRDAGTGAILRTQLVPGEACSGVWISPDASQFITLSGTLAPGSFTVPQQDITVWSMETGRVVKHHHDSNSMIDEAAWGADGRSLFLSTTRDSGGYSAPNGRDALSVFDLTASSAGKTIVGFPELSGLAILQTETHFAESPDGAALIISRGSRTQIVSMPDRRTIASWTNPGASPDSPENYFVQFIAPRTALAAPSNLSSASKGQLLRIELE
jgi:hypothetical protein